MLLGDEYVYYKNLLDVELVNTQRNIPKIQDSVQRLEARTFRLDRLRAAEVKHFATYLMGI